MRIVKIIIFTCKFLIGINDYIQSEKLGKADFPLNKK